MKAFFFFFRLRFQRRSWSVDLDRFFMSAGCVTHVQTIVELIGEKDTRAVFGDSMPHVEAFGAKNWATAFARLGKAVRQKADEVQRTPCPLIEAEFGFSRFRGQGFSFAGFNQD